MALRWHVGLPGPFTVGGRVFPRVRRSTSGGSGDDGAAVVLLVFALLPVAGVLFLIDKIALGLQSIGTAPNYDGALFQAFLVAALLVLSLTVYVSVLVFEPIAVGVGLAITGALCLIPAMAVLDVWIASDAAERVPYEIWAVNWFAHNHGWAWVLAALTVWFVVIVGLAVLTRYLYRRFADFLDKRQPPPSRQQVHNLVREMQARGWTDAEILDYLESL